MSKRINIMGEWIIVEDSAPQRVERPIRNKWYQFLHNTLAHPMLALCRPLGVKLHEWTAKRMYSDDPDDWYPADEKDVNG